MTSEVQFRRGARGEDPMLGSRRKAQIPIRLESPEVAGCDFEDWESTLQLLPERDWLDTNWEEAFNDSPSAILQPPGSNSDLPAASITDPIVRLYLRDALREPRVTDEEEKSLVWSARFGDAQARERLILGHLRLVVHLAFRYQGNGMAVADLINEGNLGLMHAADKFNTLAGVRFSTYATFWIRQRITRALDNHARTVRRPANYTQLRRQVAAAELQLQEKLGRPPEDGELAQTCNLRLATIQWVRGTGWDISLDAPSHPDRKNSLGDQLPDEQVLSPDEELVNLEKNKGLTYILSTLTERERQVLSLRYGLEDGCERTLDEVGRAIGLLRQRVHQIASKALRKLRQRHQAD